MSTPVNQPPPSVDEANSLQVVRAEPLAEAMRQGRMGAFQAVSPFAACLMPLLTALGWQGDPRHIVEALPHFAADLDLDGLRNVLIELSFVTKPHERRLDEIDPRLLPCLHVDRSGRPRVMLEAADGMMRVFDGMRREEIRLKTAAIAGTAYFIEPAETQDEIGPRKTFLGVIARRFSGVAMQLGMITLFNNVLALGFPLFALMVYDKVIGGQSRELVTYLLVGIGLTFAFDFALRMLRSRMLAYMGARVERLVAIAVLKHLLRLPVGYTEAAPIGMQLARLKEFETVREFFSGPLAGVAFDLPFLFVFFLMIAWLGGPLVLVSLLLGLVILLIGYASQYVQTNALQGMAASQAARHGLTVEIVSNLQAIKQSGSAAIWLERYRAASAAAAVDSRKLQMISGMLNALSQTLMMLTGMIVLAWGALRITDGSMSVGALVATMALSWRVLAPLQLGLMALTRLGQIRLGMAQIDRLLQLRTELSDRPGPAVVQRVFRGAITLNRVSLRYRPDAEPALLGIDLQLKPGEMIGITGHSGSGKSTILKVMAGLYQAQAGAVLLDGLDIRQMTPHELRNAVTYAPQNRHLFHGTIAQNLRLAAPTASDDDLKAALAEAGALNEILALPDGLHTGLGDHSGAHLLSIGLLQRISLARVYLRPSAVLLLDEPGQWLDEPGDAALIESLQRRKGKQTIVIVTHRPSHLTFCDRVLLMENGRIIDIRSAGKGAAVPSQGVGR
ncbi:MAG: ATP-binding cassette domain-containing protein [Ferrovibrio sp.]|uniref:peptidase domain-containing ABC transporter n=1 Tax=Ferrovibrio sp. TaxID=1917215 RepID=UPI002613C20D|nr:ATP-binding cassette domain-containing protein [Ferrovibrio sp.]MCW0234205.1 ATP-binding cassette domain-containing protein [Ferrovibrio sp.]